MAKRKLVMRFARKKSSIPFQTMSASLNLVVEHFDIYAESGFTTFSAKCHISVKQVIIDYLAGSLSQTDFDTLNKGLHNGF